MGSDMYLNPPAPPSYDAIDKTGWGIVSSGLLTASGRDEIVARFQYRKDAVGWLKAAYGSVARAKRYHSLEIKNLRKWKWDQ